jgi:hypothetical protein
VLSVTEFKGFAAPTGDTACDWADGGRHEDIRAMNTISTATTAPALRSPVARRALVVAAVVALGALALPAVAAVYKWVDPQGSVHYSDRPPPPEGKLLSVDTSAPHGRGERGESPPSRSSTAPSAAAPPAPVTGPAASPEAVARLKQTVDNDVSSARAEQCKKAQERYQSYVQSRRLYKEGPNKERIYLSDQELDTERLQAKHEVDEACGPAH